MLDECERWANQNGMEFNLKPTKSATLKQPPIPYKPLSLYEQPLALVSVHTYLGFPHRLDGIDFAERLRQGVEKAEKYLSALMVRGMFWPEWVRVCVVKAFLRPCYKYGAPLLWHLRKQPEVRRLFAKNGPLNQLHKRTVRWVMQAPWNRVATAAAIADLPHPSRRFEALAVTFVNHMQGAAGANPARNLVTWFAKHEAAARRPRSSIVVATADVRQYEKLPRVPNLPSTHPCHAEDAKQRLARRLRAWHTQQYAKSSILASYITQTCRRSEYVKRKGVRRSVGMDQCLYIRDALFRRKCIRWRLGLYGIRKQCPGCGRAFDRTHIQRCKLLDRVDHHLNNYRELVAHDRQDFPAIRSMNFMLLDALLNHKQYAAMRRIFQALNFED